MIRTRGLGISYGGRPAVSGVDLDVAPGGITVLVGPSGCGKSSVLSAMNRLVDLVPGCRTTGRVEIVGCDVRDPGCSPVALRRRVGMIFQSPQPFPMSVRRNLELPLKEHGVRGRAVLAGRVEAALREVGLWDEVRDRLNAPATSLSGGQQQRLCIARAAVLRPDVLLMDEPCSALDPMSAAAVESLIRSLRGRYTVVLVTHNIAQARRLADRIAVFWMEDGVGRLIEQGEAASVFDAPRDARVGRYLRGEL